MSCTSISASADEFQVVKCEGCVVFCFLNFDLGLRMVLLMLIFQVAC